MELYEYLINLYGYNEPIFYNEIYYKNYSRPWLQKELIALCEQGKLIRFEKGIYYIPSVTMLGVSRMDAKKIKKKKYIDNGKDIIGYYSGSTFLNMLGLSAQVPNVTEIYTNNESSRAREIPIGSQKVILRKAREKINRDNVAVLSFLELMNFTDAKFYNREKAEIVKQYMEKNRITKQSILRYAPSFPDRAMRTLVESGVIFNVTQWYRTIQTSIKKTARSYIYNYLKQENREDIIEKYGLSPFELQVQSLERTFIDKIFAICAYYLNGEITEHSRHIYDLFKIYQNVVINDNLKLLFNQVRKDRKVHYACLSAQDGVDIVSLLKEIVDKNIYKNDYENITMALLFEKVDYKTAIETLNKIIDSALLE